jgi:hypothetical protein
MQALPETVSKRSGKPVLAGAMSSLVRWHLVQVGGH